MKHASTSQADQRTNADPHYLPKELQHMLRGESDNAIGESKISRQHTHSMVPQQYAQGDYNTPMQEETSTLDDAAQTHAVMIMVHGASGGIGTSTFAALLAWMLKLEQLKCALVDLNLQAGGFDILLGQESAPGLRWSQIRAPLGTIDAQSLCQELPRWQGMPLLSSDPWKSTPAQWWEIIAALKALISCKHAVIADIGTSMPPHNALHALSNMPTGTASSSGGKHTAYTRHDEMAQLLPVPTGAAIGARSTIHVIVVEMSVLGVARAQGLIQAWKTVDISWRQCFAVGMLPDVSRSVVVDITSAQQYLGIPVVAQFRSMRSVRTSIVSGLGIPRIPRQYRKSLSRVVRACQEYAPSGAL